MLVQYNNQTYILKFKYNSELVTKERKIGERHGVLQYEHNFTEVLFRNKKDTRYDYIIMRVDCSDKDNFVKAVGRELAFLKLLKFVILDNDFRKACIEEYNKNCKNKLDVEKTLSILNFVG